MLGPPVAVRGSVWACEHDGIAIRVAKPDFPMVWATIPVRRIAMPRQDDLRLQLLGPGNAGIEVAYFEPKEYSVAM